MAQTVITAPTRAATDPGASGAPSVLAIVVTHNGREWIRDCLIALANQSYRTLDVLVVDDASMGRREQPTIKRIAKRHVRRRRWGYLRTPRPLGFGGAINWALGRIRTDADFLLFLHDDAALERSSVEHMIARMAADETTAIVGPKVVAWDDSARLEEIGMATDRFGYPYKGLEEGEIDLGQHDSTSEVFYVTSTCMLVRHSAFRQLRGWDAHMRAFAEDLDLCWRARVAGHNVRYEPGAKARHAMGLATGQRRSPFGPARYFIRRNRLRTVMKNASGLRLIGLVPQFVVLAFFEMIAFIIVRQPGEIVNIGRALIWNLIRLPQTLAERARVQRRRKLPDRKLRRLQVRESTRIRAYANFRAHRMEEAWGRRAELVAARAAQARVVGERLLGWQGAVALIAVLAVLLGFRHIIWSSPAVAGEILPFPDRPTGLWQAFLSPWQGAGLGAGAPAPPGYALLGIVPLVTLGATGMAQKLLILGLGGIAFLGAYKMLAEMLDRPARLAAGFSYALGAVGYAGTREGRLGALVLGASAPFVLGAILRLIGWMRPPGFVRGRAVARVALGTAVSGAFVPGALILYGIATVVLAAVRTFLDRGEKALRGLAAVGVGLVAGWALLLPWSLTWFSEGGPFDRLTGDATWRAFAASFADHGILSVLAGQTPVGMPLFGIALPIFGVIAVMVGEGARRRLGIALWSVVGAIGWVLSATASGALRPFVASPTEAGVLAALAFAGLTGLAVGAFRLDLPRRSLGWIHPVTIGSLGLAGFLVVAGVGPGVWHGGWDPGVASGVQEDSVVQVGSLLDAAAQQRGSFRTLWVGDEWAPRDPSAIMPTDVHLLTGPRGQQLTDLYVRDAGRPYDEFRLVLAAIESGETDLGGRLLGVFNVDFVIVERSDASVSRWLSQRDLALIRTEPDYLVLENVAALPRGALFEEVPSAARAVEARDPRLIASPASAEASATSSAPHRYTAEDIAGPGVVWLAEANDEEWRAELGGSELEQIDAGWGNGFRVPAGARGRLEITYPRSTLLVVSKLVLLLAWIVVVGAAFSGSRVRKSRLPA